MQPKETRSSDLALLAAAIFGLICAFHLGNALAGKSLFRAIHLGTALEYGRGPIDLLRPVIVGFNANGAPAAQEFPLWQAAAGLVFKLTHSDWYGWANLVSLLIFATGLWPLFQLARSHLGERAAWWSLVFYLTEPMIVLAAGWGSTDGFCLTVSVWFLFFSDRLIRTGHARWWLPATAMACLSAVTKMPFFMTVGFCSVFLLWLHRVRSWKPWLLLAGAGAVAAAVFAAWNHHTGVLAARAEYPYFELRFSASPYAVSWFFGDLKFRTSPGAWIKGAWRFAHATVGCLPLLALLLAALLRKGNGLGKAWLLAAFLAIQVFPGLILVTWHYFLMCCPAVALLCGAVLADSEECWRRYLPRNFWGTALVGLALALSALDGLITTKVAIYYDYYPKALSAVIAQYTKPDDKLILYGGDWGGEELFRSGRKGFYIYSPDDRQAPAVKGLFSLLQSETDLRRLKALGYTKLVLMSESPTRFAAEAINPGSHRVRDLYPPRISPAVDAWPVIYRSEDILIKEIPDDPAAAPAK